MSEEPYLPDFEKRGGLVAAVVQDVRTEQVLMLGWVNQEAWTRTLSSRKATFWSTSRNELWEKGATSGDWLKVVEIRVDCDDDTILYRVEPQGEGACHTKNRAGRARATCFYRQLGDNGALLNLDP